MMQPERLPRVNLPAGHPLHNFAAPTGSVGMTCKPICAIIRIM